MNYPAASSGVSKTKILNVPRGGELNPLSPPAVGHDASGRIKMKATNILIKIPQKFVLFNS